MPQRPSKKVRKQPAAKPGAQDAAAPPQGSQQRHLHETTKSILAKFQGRKSI